MKSRFKLPLAIALALGSTSVLALQLGEIRVKSALDEPLVAEIPIQLDNLSEAKDLRVGLGTPADFAKAGLSRAGLDHLRFSIVTDTTGHKLVLVTSEQPVSDPYLDFLIELDSSKGKQLREYTVLLDPVIASPPPEETAIHGAAPVAPPAPAASAAPAQIAPASRSPGAVSQQPEQPAAAQPPPSQPPPQPAPPRASPAPAAPRANEYTVQRGDTLYHIASEMRPDEQVSVDQMMLALQNTNPDAFYRGNINNLKSGAILRIPTRDSIDSTSAAQARARVHRQMEDWRGAAARTATTVAGNEAPAEPGAPAKSTAANEGDKLALVPPTQGGGSASTRPGEKGGTGTAEVGGLKQQLATAKESLASAKQDSAELQSRVRELEDIGGKNQKLLGMKDAQIADLQNKLAELRHGSAAANASSASNAAAPSASVASTTPAGAATAAAPATGASIAAVPAASTAPVQASSAAPVAVPQSAPIAKTAPAKSAPAAANTLAGTDEVQWYQRPVTWLVAGIVIVALILLGLLRRRPQPLPEPFDDEPDAPSLADQFGESPLPPPLHDEAVQHDPDLQADSEEAAREHEYESDREIEAGYDAEEPQAEATESEQDCGFAFDEPPSEEPVAEPGMPAPQLPVAGAGDITRELAASGELAEPVRDEIAQTEAANEDITREHATEAFSDDPVDTKLDLARAYLDMGDPAGARAMLEEVLNEGSQAQKEEAKRLLEDVS